MDTAVDPMQRASVFANDFCVVAIAEMRRP